MCAPKFFHPNYFKYKHFPGSKKACVMLITYRLSCVDYKLWTGC